MKPKQIKQKVYRSRKYNENFDDDQSQDEAQELNPVDEEELEMLNEMKSKGLEVQRPNPQFKNYREIFSNLMKETNVSTMYPICECIISYDSTRAIVTMKRNDKEYWVKMYCLETYKLTFEEKIGGESTDYIKMKEVEQNSSGKKYAFCYFNDGNWFLRNFEKIKRTEDEIKENELNINELLGIDKWTMAIQDFPDPYIACCFITDDKILISLFHNFSLMHYHFIYNVTTRSVEGEVVSLKMNCNKKNFPFKSFYNEDLNEVYLFYRQGQSFIIDAKDPQAYILNKMTDLDVGQMYLVYNQALVFRSSSEILFYKLYYNDITEQREWRQYNSIAERGSIYYIKGNVRIQITTDEKIYFYFINEETLQPNLDNVMFNYMNCSQMMFGSKVKYGITYKINQRSFVIYRRKYLHNFKVNVVAENLEGSKGLELKSMDIFLCSKIDKVIMYDSLTFDEIGALPLKLFPTETREPNQVIALSACQNEEYLGIITGKNLIMNEQKTNQLFIYRRRRFNNPALRDDFEYQTRVVIRDIPIFKQVSMCFHFKNSKGLDRDTIVFAKIDCIFSLNFITQQVIVIYKYGGVLNRQPQFFQTNLDQSILVVASPEDCLYINLNEEKEVDVDETYQVSSIKEIIFDEEDHLFYFLSNKYEEKLGFFVFSIKENDPLDYRFFIKYKNKLDIGDADIYILRSRKNRLKEIVISYKTIYINTFNVLVMDISGATTEKSIIFRHESFQLWESEIVGFLTNRNLDFVTLNREGINILALGSVEKRAIMDSDLQERMLHSLQSSNYLKVDPENYLLFACAKQDQREIRVQQEYTKDNGEAGLETLFLEIYGIKIWQITLRELLLLNSIYLSKTLSAIVDIVNDQPNPLVFYKTFLELDGANMVSILSFDSRSMNFLLDDCFSEHFTAQFPIFYRMKAKKGNTEKSYYRNAIDNAIKSNQVGAVDAIIKYIVKYQNNYSSSYLFKTNLPKIMEMSVEVHDLFDSKVFTFDFDYDEWPSTHTNDNMYMRPYNHSIYSIRQHYKTVFPEGEFDDISDDPDISSEKIFKIRYSINLLSMVGQHVFYENGEKVIKNKAISFLDMCTDTSELDMFQSQALKDIIEFKWAQYGFKFHLLGATIHMFQISILIFYVNFIYIQASLEFDENGKIKGGNPYAVILLGGIIYPFCYESTQMARTGVAEYLMSPSHYFDILYIFGSILMSLLHMTVNPFNILSKIVMIFVILQSIIRTFKQLRIIELYSPIVTMLQAVFYDLRIFLFFYMILVGKFSLLLGILGCANPNFDINPTYAAGRAQAIAEGEDYIGQEYADMHLLISNFLDTLKVSLGDPGSAINGSNDLSFEDNILFWLCCILVLVVTCIIFLNFIIAEASASYEKVAAELESEKMKMKATLIAQSEELMPEWMKSQNSFPKYIIIREVDT